MTTQYGDIGQRLRRFFGITGRIPSNVDETVVTTAELEQLHRAPWRRDGIQAGRSSQRIAVAGQLPYVYIECMAGAFVMEQMVVANTGATAYWTEFGFITPRTIGAFLITTEQYPFASTSGIVPVQFGNFTDAADLIGNSLVHSGGAVAATHVIPMDLVLTPGFALAWRSSVVNTELSVSVRGRWYASLPTP